MALYLLDTNILIDLFGPKRSRPFFENIGSSDLRLSTSILCVAEFVVGADAREEKLLRDWIDSGELEVIGLDEVEDAYRAARFRKKQGLTLPDALILATVFRLRAHFLTNDDTLLKKAQTLVEATDPIDSDDG